MNFDQFQKKHGLGSSATTGERVKVNITFFSHPVNIDGGEVNIVTLSKDFSLWLSSLDLHNRTEYVSAFLAEVQSCAEDSKPFHMENKMNNQTRHYLMTASVIAGVVTLHVSQR